MSSEWVGLRIPVREVRISLVLEAVEPLRVGAGRTESPAALTENPVYRHRVCHDGICEELPVIPGSSLKGVLRTVSASLSVACGVTAHTGIARYKDDCVSKLFDNVGNFDNFRKKIYRGTLSILNLETVLKGFCPTCLLYGAPSVLGRASIGDFEPVPGTLRVGVKAGVGIDRRKGAAAQRILYRVEYVEPGSRFKGVITIFNTPNWMFALLASSLKAVDDGFAKIGGFKSRGMGRVKILVDKETPQIIISPVQGSVLSKLDEEVDEESRLPSGCSVSNGVAVCIGKPAMELLESLANSWHKVYCNKLREAYLSREKEARDIVEEGRKAGDKHEHG